MEDKKVYSYNSMKKGLWDYDFDFYESGKIIHHYDVHQRKLDQIVEVKASQISEDDKQKILKDCPEEKKDFVTKILYPEQ